MQERLYWLGFAIFPGIGPRRFANLLEHFSNAALAWEAEESELSSVLGQSLAHKFSVFRKEFDFSSYLEALEQKKVSFLVLFDSLYPELLKNIPDAPFVLFYIGNEDLLKAKDRLFLGVVGTRKISSYGLTVTSQIVGDLVLEKCVIVSGLAMGVDALAHKVTVENKGSTIAVLGCGVDCCYPRENELIYKQILANGGLIVSEYGLSQAPSKGSFPSRNRIIAGLSHGIIVTEGTADSGTLITARDTFRLERKVFAVPGPINSTLSSGPNELLRQGAEIVLCSQDILSKLGKKPQLNKRKKRKIVGGTIQETKILENIAQEGKTLDQLVKLTSISSVELMRILSLLELRRYVVLGANGEYSLDTSSIM